MGCRSARDCMVLPALDCSSRWRIEPVHLKTFAERHARAMQHHPEIAIRDRENRANLITRHAVHFAHSENSADLFWQLREAITQHLPKLTAMHHLVRIGLPLMRPKIMVPKTDGHEFLRKLIGKKFHIGERCFSPNLPEMIHDLVFENADEPAP